MSGLQAARNLRQASPEEVEGCIVGPKKAYVPVFERADECGLQASGTMRQASQGKARKMTVFRLDFSYLKRRRKPSSSSSNSDVSAAADGATVGELEQRGEHVTR